MGKSRYPNYGKYVGKPTIPLSPHNSEISEDEARLDQDYLGLNDEPQSARKISKRHKVYVPKGTNRSDHGWEVRIWTYLNAPTNELKWSKVVEATTGQRSFICEQEKIEITCIESVSSNLKWRNRSDGWSEISASSSATYDNALAVLGGVIEDLRKRSSGHA